MDVLKLNPAGNGGAMLYEVAAAPETNVGNKFVIADPLVQDALGAKVMMGIFGFRTVNVAEVVAPLKPVAGLCIAEITDVPNPTSVTVEPETVATAGFELT